jgi:hypothetical protein
MQTMKLFAYQTPSRVEALLESFALHRAELPKGATQVVDRSDLPSILQKFAIQGQKKGQVWRAWMHRDLIWFLTAEMSLALSRERGLPTLQVGQYREDGRLKSWGHWVRLKDGTWQQCAL